MKREIVVYKKELGSIVVRENTKFFLSVYYKSSLYADHLGVVDEDFLEEANHDEKIKFIKIKFNWGIVTDIHEIGNYQIIEYVNNNGDVCFYTYIDFDDTNRYYNSINSALIGVICYNRYGGDVGIDKFICKMLDIEQ